MTAQNTPEPTASATIALIHGGSADASSMSTVTQQLQQAGYKVLVPPTHCAASPATLLTSLPSCVIGSAGLSS
jgi:hypothetical protein